MTVFTCFKCFTCSHSYHWGKCCPKCGATTMKVRCLVHTLRTSQRGGTLKRPFLDSRPDRFYIGKTLPDVSWYVLNRALKVIIVTYCRWLNGITQNIFSWKCNKDNVNKLEIFFKEAWTWKILIFPIQISSNCLQRFVQATILTEWRRSEINSSKKVSFTKWPRLLPTVIMFSLTLLIKMQKQSCCPVVWERCTDHSPR